ncbi:MAG: hypothetical protein AB2556_25635 [Candidatus Thiodiazotropha sp.]
MPPSPPDTGLFRYQETAEAEDQLEEEKAARAGPASTGATAA